MSRKLSAPESADYLGVSRRTFYEHCRPGLPAIRIGARVLFDPEDLDKWADLQKAGSLNDPRAAAAGPSCSPTPAGGTISAPTKKPKTQPPAQPRSSTPRHSLASARHGSAGP